MLRLRLQLALLIMAVVPVVAVVVLAGGSLNALVTGGPLPAAADGCSNSRGGRDDRSGCVDVAPGR